MKYLEKTREEEIAVEAWRRDVEVDLNQKSTA
jgi:hypothetical protein